MRPVPIPDGVAEVMGGKRVVIGEHGDPTRDDVRPCEYVVTPSEMYPGRPCVAALVELDDEDRRRVSNGATVHDQPHASEVPWSLQVIDETVPT